MPYILREDRKRLLDENGRYCGVPIRTAGELNFILCTEGLKGDWKTSEELLSRFRSIVASFYGTSEKRYQDHNNVIGAVLGASAELQRRYKEFTMKTDKPIHTIVSALLYLFEEFYSDTTGVYEDKKIVENGDIV